MNQRINFQTDTAMLAVFDPNCLRERLNDRADWWCGEFLQIKEVAEGTVAFLSTSADGVFVVRITTGELLPDERDYASETVGPLGLKVVSGIVFVGKGERISGGGFQPERDELQFGDGEFVELSAGEYDITAYWINWSDSPRWWTEGTRVQSDAPADIVLILKPRERPFPGTTGKARFSGLGKEFLFKSSTRQIGPAPGTVFTTEVWKNANGLTLKAAGPCSYKPVLHDFTGLAWRDRVKVRAESVDHAARTVDVEVLEKLR